MVIRGLPLVTGLVPLIGINLAYWIGVNADVLPSCIPYFDGCTSISATGRYPPGDRLFRAIMLPQAVLLAVTWSFAVLWLRSLSPQSKAAIPALIFGLTGAAALILYVSYLGTKEPFYELMRRFGIYLYFLGTAVAQMILTLGLARSRVRQSMLWIVAVPWLLGLVNFAQKTLRENPDRMENIIEWIVSVFMQIWFVLLYVAWRKTKFTVSVGTG
jgi:hypothetical protein